jgi:hypothetical protein
MKNDGGKTTHHHPCLGTPQKMLAVSQEPACYWGLANMPPNEVGSKKNYVEMTLQGRLPRRRTEIDNGKPKFAIQMERKRAAGVNSA